MNSNYWSTGESGQALPEYSILISVITIVVVAVFALAGPALVDLLQVLVDIF